MRAPRACGHGWNQPLTPSRGRAQLEILCRDQVLGSEHTMEYISKTMWDADSGALTLHYRQAK